ncbi:MAG: heme biosynthesis HemY N-terminal domain-containing protein [Micavibrio sp.]|nr:heme biosynthesis HemY N-terminal domain-containing protein [Micavibrio sp.]
MIRALWFLAKLAVLVGAAIWLVQNKGSISIVWQGYLIETSTSFVIVALLLLLFIWTLCYRAFRAFVGVPRVYRRYKIASLRENGYRAVTQGLVAVAAGDGRSAERYARKAEDMIPGTPLTRLLVAQTALMNGNAPKARREFAELLEDNDAAFFGVRGLLNDTLQQGNYREALALIRKADELQPGRDWVVRTLFDLETRNREWPKAERTLKKAEKMGLIDKDTGRRHRQAIWTAMADENILLAHTAVATRLAESAFGLDAGFTPAALRLVSLYTSAEKRRAAIKTIEKAWAANPHPALATLWMNFQPAPKKQKSIYDTGRETFDWMKQLHDLQPEHRDSNRALGAAALQARMWKEARDYLMKANDYRMLARLEREESGNEGKAREYLELAADSPADARWVCRSCGHVAFDWQGLCPRCGAFDQLAWMTPSLEAHDPKNALTLPQGAFIEPPQHRTAGLV